MSPWCEPHYATVDRELLLRFFVTFARFEFALKNSGFFKRRRARPGLPPDAEPDWDCFGCSIRAEFRPGLGSTTVRSFRLPGAQEPARP